MELFSEEMGKEWGRHRYCVMTAELALDEEQTTP